MKSIHDLNRNKIVGLRSATYNFEESTVRSELKKVSKPDAIFRMGGGGLGPPWPHADESAADAQP